MTSDLPGDRPDLVQLADDAVRELVASGQFASYSGRLPPGARARLDALRQRFDDESALEDLFSERMVALTRNAYVAEAGDDTFTERVIQPSHVRPVMVDVYTDFCRPCNHVLPIVYQLADKYRDVLSVVKINVSTHERFRHTYLGAVQMTPAFLFFRHGRPLPVSGRLARLLGQTAFVSSTRAGLEKRIRQVLAAERTPGRS